MLSSLESPAANSAGAHSLAFLNPLLRHTVIYGGRGYRNGDKGDDINDNWSNEYRIPKTKAIGRIDGVLEDEVNRGGCSRRGKDDSGIQDWLSRACGGSSDGAIKRRAWWGTGSG